MYSCGLFATQNKDHDGKFTQVKYQQLVVPSRLFGVVTPSGYIYPQVSLSPDT